jgi:hypothetical protein
MISGAARTRLHVLALRWLALASFALWFGGFTFYSAVVIPVIEEAMGRAEAGSLVTREVTDTLNLIGVATLILWWLLAWFERSLGGTWAPRLRVGLLAIDTAVLVGLFALHKVLERRLDEGRMEGFYPLHETYLIARTAQWVANLALLAASVWIWRSSQRAADAPWPMTEKSVIGHG